MWLTRLAIDRPFVTVLLYLGLLVGGLVSWRRLPVDLNPRAELPNVIVTAVYPGAGPAAVEQLVAQPLEEALTGVAGVKHVFTYSQEGFCYAYVEFHEGTDMTVALTDCRQAVEGIRGDLPEALRPPTFAQLDINAQPVLFFGLIGRRPLEELRRLADEQVKPALGKVDGVAEVTVLGGREEEIAVEVELAALAAGNLTLSGLLEPLQAASRNVPAGRLTTDGQELGVRALGEIESLSELRAVPLPPAFDPAALIPRSAPRAREPARWPTLGEIAEIKPVARDPEIRIRLQQQPAVGVIVTRHGRSNTVAVARRARAALDALALPAGVEVVVARDTALTVHEALADVNASILLGILLCAATIFLFLRNWRGTLIVATSIPVCLIGTFALMAFGGNTLNQMTLLGLALSVGILVDDSIVCLEAITWRLQRGEPADSAAFNGRNDIALADTSTTLIDLAVFVPIALMHGIVGQFFRDFGFVVAAAAALSLLTAYTLVPMLAAVSYARRPLGAERERDRLVYRRLEIAYRRTLRWSLGHRAAVLLGGWSLLLLAGGLAWWRLGQDFIPAADLSTVVVNLELPAGTSASRCEATVAEAEALIARVPEVQTLFTTLGQIETGFGVVNRRGPQYAQINVTLTDRRGLLDVLLLRGFDLRRRADNAVADDIRAAVTPLGEGRWQVFAVHGWSGAGAPVDLSLYGQDLKALATVGEQLLARLEALPQLLNADLAWRLGQPEMQVVVDRERAAANQVFPAQVGRELRLALEGDDGLTIRLDERQLPVRVRLRGLDRRSPEDLARLPVGRTGARPVTVGDVATLTRGAGPTRIDRRDGLRELNFKAYLAAGVNLGEARQAVEAELAALGLRYERAPALPGGPHPGLVWGWRGDAETMAASAGPMAGTALLAAVLVYGIMAALFNSPLHPLTIMLSVPMAVTGALLALVATGSSLSIVAGIGLILLLGIVVRNAILLVDHILQLRAEGIERQTAVIASGVRRLRPILMTTLTTIFGMLPVALRLGKGAEIRAPMAIAVIGGLALSTLLTLVIIPVTYVLFDDWSTRRRKG